MTDDVHRFFHCYPSIWTTILLLWISCPIISDSIENLHTMSIMKDFSWKTSWINERLVISSERLFKKTKDIILQLSDFSTSSSSTERKVQERLNFLDIMKDYSSDRKTLEFLLLRQNERQLRKTSWIGLLSLLLDDNFRHYNQEREKFWMHAFFDASFERLFKGRGKSYRKDWNIFLQAKNADERLHIILRKTCLFDGKWLFLISEDVFWFERLESTICGDTHKTYRLIFFTLKICTFSENRGKMKGGIFFLLCL